MEKRCFIILLLVLCLAFAGDSCYAGTDTLSQKYPAAVLVQLKSERNRIEALTRDRKYKELEEVKKDAVGENEAMVNDFSTYFNFCPVYYYMDTNLDFILKKEFDGILMNADMSPVKNIAINASSKNYVIVFYGYPVVQPHHKKVVTDSSTYLSDSGEPMGEGLVINNDKMQQINYLYKLGFNRAGNRQAVKKNFYTSRHFSIEYYPCAENFNRRLKKRKNQHQMKIGRRL